MRLLVVALLSLTGCTSTGQCVFPPHYDLCGNPSDILRQEPHDGGP